MSRGRVLHCGALVALARGSVYMGSLLRTAVDHNVTLAVPAEGLARAWAQAGDGQYRLSALLALHVTMAVPMSEPVAIAVGDLLAASGSDDTVSAHTVYVAAEYGWPVVTDDAAPLRALKSQIDIDVLP